MAEIRLADVGHQYVAGEHALRSVDVTWEDGGAYALLGPSGCGKTTMLDIISGLLRPTAGQVLFDGEDVTDRNAVERNIAQVFQFPVLYDSMTVEENMRFPLRNRGVPKQEARRRAHEIAELLEITHLLDQRARGLPADAKQLVSLSRALVRRDVSAILFDEPLTVIDPQKRWTLRQALKRVHAELSHTLVYVTHDQIEALTFADVVVVMDEGELMQRGTPDELFERPAHRFVGHFIGSPGMNFLPATVRDGVAGVAGVDLLRLPEAAGRDQGTDDVLGVRPEHVRCGPDPAPEAIAATVGTVRDLGASHLVELVLDRPAGSGGTSPGGSGSAGNGSAGNGSGADGGPTLALVARIPPERDVPSGRCWVDFEPDRVHLFRDGRRLEGCRPIPATPDAGVM